MNGKGSSPRPTNLLKFRANFDLIKGFGENKNISKEKPVKKSTKKL